MVGGPTYHQIQGIKVASVVAQHLPYCSPCISLCSTESQVELLLILFAKRERESTTNQSSVFYPWLRHYGMGQRVWYLEGAVGPESSKQVNDSF